MPFSAEDRAKYGAAKIDLLEQLIAAAGLPAPSGDLAAYVIDVPDLDDSDSLPTRFGSCTADELRRALAKAQPPPRPQPDPKPAPPEPAPPQPAPSKPKPKPAPSPRPSPPIPRAPVRWGWYVLYLAAVLLTVWWVSRNSR